MKMKKTHFFAAIVSVALLAHLAVAAETKIGQQAIPIEKFNTEQVAQPMFHTGSAVMQGSRVQVEGMIVSMLIMEFHAQPTLQGKDSDKPFMAAVSGNINCDQLNRVDMADLIFLIDYLFHQGKAPAVPAAADLNGDSLIDLADLKLLQERLYAPNKEQTPVTTEMK